MVPVAIIKSHANLSFFIKLLVFEYCLHSNHLFSQALPIDTTFTFPAPLPKWPPGGGFAAGMIDFGGLKVRQVSMFHRVWRGEKGGVDDQGASFFEPSSIPAGFSMLASYGQPNAQELFGWVLVAKTDARDALGDILKQPTDYSLVYKTSGNSPGYFWLPIPPTGYKAVGYVVTTSPDKPSRDKIRCVRSDFTDETETDTWIWGPGDGANMYALRPKKRGANAEAVSVGGFYIIPNANGDNSKITVACLKNKNSKTSAMPNLSQVQALFQAYSPYIYLHPDEAFLPSSVNWFFHTGALLYKKGEEWNRSGIHPNGTNLPQGGNDDGLYWIDLPQLEEVQDKIKKGDLQSADTNLHVKSVLGGTFTDIQVWLFYPFNGPGIAKVLFIKRIKLGKIGEHLGDWEHVTLRISNYDGILYKVYFGQHNKGQWVDSSLLEFRKDNKFVGYSALHSHATYYKPGLVLLGGNKNIGIRDDTDKSNTVWDTGARFSVVAGDGLSLLEPPWLNYMREWGPKKDTTIGKDLKEILKLLKGKLKAAFEKLINKLPHEILGEEGPTGPKVKNNWIGDEDV